MDGLAPLSLSWVSWLDPSQCPVSSLPNVILKSVFFDKYCKTLFIWIHNGPPTGITSKNTSENIALFVEIVSKLKWRCADSTWRIFAEAMPSLWIQWNIAHKGSFLWKPRSCSLDLYLNVISKFRYYVVNQIYHQIIRINFIVPHIYWPINLLN